MNVLKTNQHLIKSKMVFATLILATILSQAFAETDLITADQLRFTNGTLDGWEAVGDNTWVITPQEDKGFKVSSGEQTTGTLKSKPFIRIFKAKNELK